MTHASITRRDFIQTAAGAAGVAIAGSVATQTPSRAASHPSDAVRPGQPSDQSAPHSSRPAGGTYIDDHVHLGRTWNGQEELTVDLLLAWMDEHDIERAVLLPLMSPESSAYYVLPEAGFAAAAAHPDRFIPFCSIDPRTSYQGGHEGLVAILQEYFDRGAKGFGEHKVGLTFDDPLMMNVYAACSELRLPVLFHMDNLRGRDLPGLPALEHVLETFPDLVLIGHGPGWWASISADVDQEGLGGYPNGPVAPGGAIDRLMDAYPNLYGDLSAGSGAGAISRDREFGREFLIRRSERLLFGTDYLAPGQAVPQFELFASLDLPEEVERRIFRENAVRVLGLA